MNEQLNIKKQNKTKIILMVLTRKGIKLLKYSIYECFYISKWNKYMNEGMIMNE